MNFIVVGCGRVGAELAYRLFKRGHKIAVIDTKESAFKNLPEDFRGRMVHGEALQKEILHRAGIDYADGLATVTSSDMTNAVVARIARLVYNVPNVLVRNFNPLWRPMHEAFGHQVISSSSWGAQRMEELLYHYEVTTVFSAGNGEVELYEFMIPAEWEGRTLNELLPENGCSPSALTRAGRAILPDCNARLQTSDLVLVSATFEGINALRTQLRMLQDASAKEV